MAKRLKVTEDRLWRGGRLTNHLSRLKHLRGHGVHSPYIYSIVRNVFMGRRKSKPQNSEIFKSLLALGIKQHTAVEISQVAAHCGFESFGVDCDQNCAEMIICSTKCDEQRIQRIATNGTAIVILAPYKRSTLCNQLLKAHGGTSIDRFSYLLLLNNHLPKQHFKL